MRSLIFSTAARALMPLMLLLSVVVLLRGHNEPGGGFVGGLLAASALSLYALAVGVRQARARLRAHPRTLIAAGLLIAALSGVPGMVAGGPFMQGLWTSVALPGFAEKLKVGTPVVFDIGVYLVVMGSVLLMVFTLEEQRRGESGTAAGSGVADGTGAGR